MKNLTDVVAFIYTEDGYVVDIKGYKNYYSSLSFSEIEDFEWRCYYPNFWKSVCKISPSINISLAQKLRDIKRFKRSTTSQ